MDIQDMLDNIRNNINSSEDDFGRRCCWYVPGSLVGVVLPEILRRHKKVSVEKSTKPDNLVITVLREY